MVQQMPIPAHDQQSSSTMMVGPAVQQLFINKIHPFLRVEVEMRRSSGLLLKDDNCLIRQNLEQWDARGLNNSERRAECCEKFINDFAQYKGYLLDSRTYDECGFPNPEGSV
ncbi:hypothetical protein H6504_05190 [Candidatus Woesearchaeota archaeon]|nr:hypothetical protein [Candidatus Woesearchaeota archaeon]